MYTRPLSSKLSVTTHRKCQLKLPCQRHTQTEVNTDCHHHEAGQPTIPPCMRDGVKDSGHEKRKPSSYDWDKHTLSEWMETVLQTRALSAAQEEFTKP